MARFQSLAKTLAPYAEAGSFSVREYVMAAGGKKKKGSPYSKEQEQRITEIKKQTGAARRTVERWAAARGSVKEEREVGGKYKNKLREILTGDRKFKPLVVRFIGTLVFSDIPSYRDGGKGSPGVRWELTAKEVEGLVTTFENEGEEAAEKYFLEEGYKSGGEFTHPEKGDPVFKVE